MSHLHWLAVATTVGLVVRLPPPTVAHPQCLDSEPPFAGESRQVSLACLHDLLCGNARRRNMVGRWWNKMRFKA